MSTPTTNTESAPITQVAPRKSMTDEEMPKSLQRPARTLECNMISYTDGEGAKKEIWLPKGTMLTACKHFEKNDWDALAKFPVWSKFTISFCERLQVKKV